MTDISDRKNQHINVVVNKNVEPIQSSFDNYRLEYSALPGISMDEIDTSTQFFNHNLSFPFLISSMTGGSEFTKKINENIAIACEEVGVGFGLGSMRVIIEKPEAIDSFDVKRFCPTVPMYANVGLVQLNYGFGYDEIQKIIDLVGADGIFFHINHLQEAVQPGGDTDYRNLIEKFEGIIKRINVPIVVKEVGHGIDYRTAIRLNDIGIEWVDVSGLGGTSWSWIEGYRRLNEGEVMNQENLGFIFKQEGIPTTECIENLKGIKNLNLIAGGGIRNGLHISKSIAMGAKLATAAKPFLNAALESSEAVIKELNRFKHEFRVSMYSAGAKNLTELAEKKIVKTC